MNRYSQEELKALTLKEAQDLAEEIRRYLVEHVPLTGGHLASNLGIVEISLGLLRVFSLPSDDILYDTGHQSYVHKILTGREEDFLSLRQYGGISGFPKRSESEYDSFGAGHSGTAISAALGLSRARALLHPAQSGHHTVALLGDGALTNGMVYEALNNIRRDDKLIIVLNDNEMSISKSVGRLSRYLTRVRKSEQYFSLKNTSRDVLEHIPLIGAPVERALSRVKNSVKTLIYRENLFEQLGVYYLGPGDGNDLGEVERLLQEARRHHGPVLLHLTTKKGKGFAPAEQDPGKYHSVSGANPGKKSESFSLVFGRALSEFAARDKKIVAITAAMESGCGLDGFHRQFPRRFFDVGIAEEHAMTFAAGLSAGGLKPVFAVYSTFFQRAYDQLFHDLSLQGLGAVIALDRAGFADSDGPTHHGLFDVPLALQLPGVEIYSPATYREMTRFLKEALSPAPENAVILRYPKGAEKELISECFACERSVERWDCGEGIRVLILTYGRITEQAILAARRLEKTGIGVTVVKLACLKPFDLAALRACLEEKCYDLCYCLEEGIMAGGFFEGLLARLACENSGDLARKYHIRAVEDSYVPHGSYEQLLQHCGMDALSVSEEIAGLL